MANTNRADIQLASDLRTVMVRLVKKLRKKSETGTALSLTERSTMSLLDQHGELLPNQLAGMEQITNQSMSQILKHLDELGYIKRKISKEDRRNSIITLSPKGTSLLRQVQSERDTWFSNAINETCTAHEIGVLRKAIQPLTRLLNLEDRD